MDFSDWVSAFAGLVGVVLGGLITFFTERHFRSLDSKRGRIERLNRVHRTTHAVFNELLTLERQMLEKVPTPHPAQLWIYIKPMMGVDPAPLSYSYDDMAVLAGPKYDELANNLMEILAFRNVLVATIGVYNEARHRLADLLMPYTTVLSATTVATDPSYKTSPSIMRVELEVESLAAHFANTLLEMKAKIESVTPEYNSKLKDFFPKSKVAPSIQLPAST